MAEVSQTSVGGSGTTVPWTATAAISAYEMVQLPDGRAGYSTSDVASGASGTFQTLGVITVAKTASIALLTGMPVYWDFSANSATFKAVSDRDFFIGVATADALESDANVTVNVNVQPAWTHDLMRDGFTTAIVGTQALGGLALNYRGGTLNVVISATNEAQKVDALSKRSFSKDANGIVKIVATVVSDGAGTVVDVSLGVASATHATDADSIAQHFFAHLDANVTKINFQSKDGTTTVASTDSLATYTEGTRFEIWLDMRDPTAQRVYVEGVRKLSSTTFSVNNAASEWKLLVHVEKTAAADTYELDVEECKVMTQN